MQEGRPQPVVLARKGMVNVGENAVGPVAQLPGIENEDTETARAVPWRYFGVISMTKPNGSEQLKQRAKRLRAAIGGALGVKITIAQSLELVAQEENYPNWDSASANYSRNNEAPVLRPQRFVKLHDLDIRSTHVLVSGRTHSGKSTLAQAIANHYSRTLRKRLKKEGPYDIVVIAPTKEWETPSFLSPHYDSDFWEKVSQLNLSHSVLMIDEPRAEGISTEQWLELANKAAAAVVTMHGNGLGQLPESFQHVDYDSLSKRAIR